MKTYRWQLALLVSLVGYAATAQSNITNAPQPNLTITIDIYNYANVEQKTLLEAETAATGILRETGVGTQWIDMSDENQAEWIEKRSLDLTHINLDILPRAMSDRLRLSNDEVMGLAPGVGPDRQIVYVFYDRIDRVNDTKLQLEARLGGIYVRTSQTFGDAIAHEVGHLLLNTDAHSKTGVMRGKWQLEDLREVALGRLLFTTQQGELIRAEVARRVGRHPTVDVASPK